MATTLTWKIEKNEQLLWQHLFLLIFYDKIKICFELLVGIKLMGHLPFSTAFFLFFFYFIGFFLPLFNNAAVKGRRGRESRGQAAALAMGTCSPTEVNWCPTADLFTSNSRITGFHNSIDLLCAAKQTRTVTLVTSEFLKFNKLITEFKKNPKNNFPELKDKSQFFSSSKCNKMQ